MNKSTLLLILSLLALGRVGAEPAKALPSTAGPATYESFRFVHTRNVFDPDRRPIRPANGPVSVAPTQADYAALTGTMISTDKTYAFFSGSRPDFNKVLSVHDKFVNATITAITAQSIDVERDGKTTTILIGQTVPFDNQTAPGEPPVVSPPTDTPPTFAAPLANSYRPAPGGNFPYRAPTAGSPAPAATPRVVPGNLEDIRRRMMEKRQQDLK